MSINQYVTNQQLKDFSELENRMTELLDQMLFSKDTYDITDIPFLELLKLLTYENAHWYGPEMKTAYFTNNDELDQKWTDEFLNLESNKYKFNSYYG